MYGAAERVLGATHYQRAAFPALLALVRSRAVDQIQIPTTRETVSPSASSCRRRPAMASA